MPLRSKEVTLIANVRFRESPCLLAVLLLLAPIVPLACGDESGSGTSPQRLSAAEESIIGHSQVSVRGYCRGLARYLAGKRGPLTAPETEQVDNGLERLIALARQKPDARLSSGQTLRQVLGDMAEDLEGSNCSASFEQKLEQGLAALPPER